MKSLIILVMCSVMLAFPALAPMASGSSTSKVTTVTLSNKPSSSDWSILSPIWTFHSGKLDGSGLTGFLSPKIVSSSTFPSDRTFQVKFKTVVQGAQPWYVAWEVGKYVSETDRTGIILGTTGGLEMFVSQQQPTGLVDHHYTTQTTLSDLNWHTLTVVYSGNNAQVSVDNVLYLTVTDPIIGALGASQVELASWGNSESQFSTATISY